MSQKSKRQSHNIRSAAILYVIAGLLIGAVGMMMIIRAIRPLSKGIPDGCPDSTTMMNTWYYLPAAEMAFVNEVYFPEPTLTAKCKVYLGNGDFLYIEPETAWIMYKYIGTQVQDAHLISEITLEIKDGDLIATDFQVIAANVSFVQDQVMNPRFIDIDWTNYYHTRYAINKYGPSPTLVIDYGGYTYAVFPRRLFDSDENIGFLGWSHAQYIMRISPAE